MKTFTPKFAKLTKKQIWSFFYEWMSDEKKYLCYGTSFADGDDYLVKKPAYTAEEIPDKHCQAFVDKEYLLCGNYGNEEDMVDARNDLVADFHRRILRSLKRKG